MEVLEPDLVSRIPTWNGSIGTRPGIQDTNLEVLEPDLVSRILWHPRSLKLLMCWFSNVFVSNVFVSRSKSLGKQKVTDVSIRI